MYNIVRMILIFSEYLLKGFSYPFGYHFIYKEAANAKYLNNMISSYQVVNDDDDSNWIGQLYLHFSLEPIKCYLCAQIFHFPLTLVSVFWLNMNFHLIHIPFGTNEWMKMASSGKFVELTAHTIDIVMSQSRSFYFRRKFYHSSCTAFFNSSSYSFISMDVICSTWLNHHLIHFLWEDIRNGLEYQMIIEWKFYKKLNAILLCFSFVSPCTISIEYGDMLTWRTIMWRG